MEDTKTKKTYNKRKYTKREYSKKKGDSNTIQENSLQNKGKVFSTIKDEKSRDKIEKNNKVIRKKEEKDTAVVNKVLEKKRRRNPNLDFKFKKSNLKIIALGGLDEIGKNITVFEYENEIILVDCGLEFPDDDMLGVDLVIPDFTYLVKNQEKIKGLFITHGHEDHIGSIPYLLKQINIPIYATRLTAKLIEHKLEEHKLLATAKINVVEQGQTINAGKMQVEFIRSSHSIPDACMLAIHTPAGVVIHTGDFKVDYTPIDGQKNGFRKTC